MDDAMKEEIVVSNPEALDVSSHEEQGCDSEGPGEPAKIITRLAELPAKALLDEQAVADIFGVAKRTVRRMVARFELPPPVLLAGRSTWIAERIIAHVEARAERAARKAEQEARRIE